MTASDDDLPECHIIVKIKGRRLRSRLFGAQVESNGIRSGGNNYPERALGHILFVSCH